MTSKDMHDLFTPGTVVSVMTVNVDEFVGELIGWREQGVVVRGIADTVFLPFSNIIYIAIKKEN